MTVVQRPLDLPEPEFTEAQLRAAHKAGRLPISFESSMVAPWGPSLLRIGARAMSRRAARAH
jgi:hypothetical protein